MRKNRKRIGVSIAFILMMICVFSEKQTVCAQELPDLSRIGSITVEMRYNSQPVEGGELCLYRVGDLEIEDGNCRFVTTDSMGDCPILLEDIEWEEIESPELAAQLAEYLESRDPDSQNLRGVPEGIEPVYPSEGTAYFGGLTPGLYLAVQTKAAPGYCLLNPFLVSIPLWEDSTYIYDVDAHGKFELEKAPGQPEKPETPQPSGTSVGEKLPQTGQLNWPVPVMACAGMVLFLLGWALRSGEIRKSREAM